jgi:hypothetical protein
LTVERNIAGPGKRDKRIQPECVVSVAKLLVLSTLSRLRFSSNMRRLLPHASSSLLLPRSLLLS